MHPQIVQRGFGSCPICGMALEPRVVTREEKANPELANMARRFWVGLALAIPVVVLEMGGHLAGLHAFIAPRVSGWLQLALATPVVLWGGWPFFVRGWASVVARSLNMFTLVAMGTGVNMFRLRVTSDRAARWKNGQPAHSTTGVASASWIQFDA